MLVLSRKKFESVRIGDDVTVTVCEIRGDKVRLAFDAPKPIPVHREEVYQAINRLNREAAIVEIETVDSINKMPFLVDGVDRSNGNNKSEVRE